MKSRPRFLIRSDEEIRSSPAGRTHPASAAPLVVFILGSKPPIWPSLLRLGQQIYTEDGLLGVCFSPPIWCLGGYTFFHPHCYVNPSGQCAGNHLRWAEVSMTCTVMRPTVGIFKLGNGLSQQSVHHFIHRCQDEQLHSCWDPGDASVPSVSVAVLVVHLLL